ncbi:MAG: UDP-N-acetylmuramate dehydrogenase [Candidatus Kapabacteria bacterium]|nr:UDP-N-acetylmuramate dehydrogenase [Candidatus Kapabacteria bacterium]
MEIQRNISLKPYNTFALEAKAAGFCTVSTVEEIQTLLAQEREQKKFPSLFILGGGSNILFTANVEALVVKIALKGTTILHETATTLDVEIAAGEEWDNAVQNAVTQNWGGLENLSLIPGSVGAAPVQNIGAYGVELQNVLVSVRGIMRSTGEKRELSCEECFFGYRDSIFKRDLREKFIITSVVLRLQKNPTTVSELSVSYGALAEEIERLFLGVRREDYTIQHVRSAVCSVRRSKLPNPAVIGNAGSFFKNPTVPHEIYNRIKSTYPEVPSFPVSENLVKIPAGWMIERCGWKGKRLMPASDAAVHDKQALVLVNHGAATGEEILELSRQIQSSVQEHFGVALETEVNIF